MMKNKGTALSRENLLIMYGDIIIMVTQEPLTLI